MQNWNQLTFWKQAFFFLSSDSCYKMMLLESLNIPLNVHQMCWITKHDGNAYIFAVADHEVSAWYTSAKSLEVLCYFELTNKYQVHVSYSSKIDNTSLPIFGIKSIQTCILTLHFVVCIFSTHPPLYVMHFNKTWNKPHRPILRYGQLKLA